MTLTDITKFFRQRCLHNHVDGEDSDHIDEKPTSYVRFGNLFRIVVNLIGLILKRIPEVDEDLKKEDEVERNLQTPKVYILLLKRWKCQTDRSSEARD